MLEAPTIYYLCPDHQTPSWGVGLLYAHVRILCDAGINAVILHQRSPFVVDWLVDSVPIRYLDDSSLKVSEKDIMVVPEVLVNTPEAQQYPCNRIVFVQGSFLIHRGLAGAKDYQTLGYERAMVILPLMKQIVEHHYGICADIVSPFIAPYFYLSDESDTQGKRLKQIVAVPKPGYETVGYYDYQIVRQHILQHLADKSEWSFVELSNIRHQEVAQVLRESAFFLSVNCLEGFNTTVAEAMAAGCIPICYDAFGGREYLRYKENAFVFPNNHLYPLLECLYEQIAQFDAGAGELDTIRLAGYRTAKEYSRTRTSQELLQFFSYFVDGTIALVQ